MGTRLFVGGLPWAADERELGQAFSGFGTVVDIKVIRDPETGRSRGFGFVTLSNQEEATAAIKQLDGSSIGGRTVTVREAQERAGGPGRGDGPPRGGPGGYAGGGDRPERGYRSGPPGDGGDRGYRSGPPAEGGYRSGPPGGGDRGYRGGPGDGGGFRGGPGGGDGGYRGDRGAPDRGGPDRGFRSGPPGEGGDRGFRSGPPADRPPMGDRRDGPDSRPPRPPMDRGQGWGGGDRPSGGFGDRPPRPAGSWGGGGGGGGAAWARQAPPPTESWGEDRGPRRKEGSRAPERKKGRGFDDWGGGNVEDKAGKRKDKGRISLDDWEEPDDE